MAHGFTDLSKEAKAKEHEENLNERNLLDTIISPFSDEDSKTLAQRRRDGRFALQICVDTIAYAFNVPLRLAMLGNEQDICTRLSSLMGNASDKPLSPCRVILKEIDRPTSPGIVANILCDSEQYEKHNKQILSLVESNCGNKRISKLESTINPEWIRGMLAILPHLERRIWLTEIANPLPIHGLCRMYDPWSLYILMWTTKYLFDDHQTKEFKKALGIKNLYICTLTPSNFKNRAGEITKCMPVLGPIFAGDNLTEIEQNFIGKFDTFNRNAQDIGIDWGDNASGKPSGEELQDANQSRLSLPIEEIKRRADHCQRSLSYLYTTIVDNKIEINLSREFWEKLATGCAWVARSEEEIKNICKKDSRRKRIIELDNKYSLTLDYSDKNNEIIQLHIEATQSIHDVTETYSSHYQMHCDNIPALLNRVRERQSAAWSSQIIAINNLLNRHDPPVKSKVPRDVLVSVNEATPEIGHLLRGFGNRVCRYLVSITRADVVSLYWADYAQSPTRMVNVGCHARLVEHQARIKDIQIDFQRWSWSSDGRIGSECPANKRNLSPSQIYRSLALGVEDSASDIAIKSANDFLNNSRDETTRMTYFGGYPDPKPKDSIALPLMLNGRPVGVMALDGLTAKQFESRIFIPLRRAASLLATCMYHQSQLWHMRILNTFFINYQAGSWGEVPRTQKTSKENSANLLETVSRCLCNIFLCPVAHLWTRSSDNSNSFELSGYNWPFLINNTPSNEQKSIFTYSPQNNKSNSRTPANSKFADLAIDLYKDNKTNLGMFVWGRFDHERKESINFSAESASTIGALVGNDMINNMLPGADHRKTIFSPLPKGYALTDIMSFPLLRKIKKSGDLDELEVVGVVTLHDWLRTQATEEGKENPRPWDRGWRTVVAHMQTYLPYLFEQVEILNNPLVDARRFLIHAGRAEIISIIDSSRLLRIRFSQALAPDSNTRNVISQLASGNYFQHEKMFSGRDINTLLKNRLGNVSMSINQAWGAIENLTDLSREQNLVQLANVMHRYRDLASLSIDISESTQIVNLRDAVDEILKGFTKSLFDRGVFKSNEIPENIYLHLPSLWFKIVLSDLFHNAAKYATSGLALEIKWDSKAGTLSIHNEGSYDPNLDNPQRLLMQGERGSAAKSFEKSTERGGTSTQSSVITHDFHGIGGAGHGMGLWGGHIMCELMNIQFFFEIIPSTWKHNDDSNKSRMRARYIVKLKFPRAMLNTFRPPSYRQQSTDPDFY